MTTLLLDTHTFLWWLSDPNQMTSAATDAIAEPNNRVYVSVISLWEIALKRAIGKLVAPIDITKDVAGAGFELLPLKVEHIVKSETLPLHHRDPFDRMLVAQAAVEGATIVSRDSNMSLYTSPLIIA